MSILRCVMGNTGELTRKAKGSESLLAGRWHLGEGVEAPSVGYDDDWNVQQKI